MLIALYAFDFFPSLMSYYNFTCCLTISSKYLGALENKASIFRVTLLMPS